MKKIIKVGSDFSGVGAFDFAIKRIAAKKNLEIKNIFACDMDKFARESYLANHEAPDDYPSNVYERDIPNCSLDIYMTSPPCQAFSIAGKRKGKDDERGRGILFFNSLEFIETNRPRFFIFENVKGLLSHDKPRDSSSEFGRTFQEWINHLGGKSINGLANLFPEENSVPYHLYFKVLNTKEHGVPQNRERVFLIGIRDDEDNVFSWPNEEPTTKRLKDVLEENVDTKYFLSEKLIENLLIYNDRQIENNRGFSAKFRDVETVKYMDALKCGGGGKDDLIKIKSATSNPFEVAEENDSVNFSVPNSETRRGRVGKQCAQTLDTGCQQGVIIGTIRSDEGFRTMKDNVSPTLCARAREDGSGQSVVCIPVLTPDRAEKRQNGRRFKDDGDPSFTLTTQDRHGVLNGYSIRRLTPRECFRLQDFPDSFKFVVSDSQLYKQAGNSITVRVLEKILDKLKL